MTRSNGDPGAVSVTAEEFVHQVRVVILGRKMGKHQELHPGGSMGPEKVECLVI